MKTLHEVAASPSGWDSYDNYAGETPSKNLLVVCTRSRDPDLLGESNWVSALGELGGEDGESVVIHRFGHWACGWWEALCVLKGSDKEPIGERICESIEAYPILNESDFEKREERAADEFWKTLDIKERVDHVRTFGGDDNCDTIGDLLALIRGDYAPYGNSGYEGLI